MARSQHGVVGYEQLLGCGASRRQVERMVATGEARPVSLGVYLLGPELTHEGWALAGVLCCGPGAVVSHQSATQLYRMLPRPPGVRAVDVTITRRHRGRRPGVRVHRTSTLKPDERRIRDGVPVTAPGRTLIDLAGCATAAELEAAVSEAFALRLTNRSGLLRVISRCPGRRGVARLRTLLASPRQPARTRSVPERTLLTGLRRAGLPEPQANVKVGRWEADLYWPEHALVVEVDGYAAHSSPTAFERDRIKDAELADLGLTVRRISARQIRDDLPAALARLARELE